MGSETGKVYSGMLGAAYARLWTVAAAYSTDQRGAERLVEAAVEDLRIERPKLPTEGDFVAWMSRRIREAARNPRNLAPDCKSGAETRHAGWGVGCVGQSREADERGDRAGTSRGGFGDRVMEGLQAIEPDARACVMLRVTNQLSYAEIGLQLELSAATAMSKVHSARVALRDALQPETAQARKDG